MGSASNRPFFDTKLRLCRQKVLGWVLHAQVAEDDVNCICRFLMKFLVYELGGCRNAVELVLWERRCKMVEVCSQEAKDQPRRGGEKFRGLEIARQPGRELGLLTSYNSKPTPKTQDPYPKPKSNTT